MSVLVFLLKSRFLFASPNSEIFVADLVRKPDLGDLLFRANLVIPGFEPGISSYCFYPERKYADSYGCPLAYSL
jgi:hypothetical protein